MYLYVQITRQKATHCDIIDFKGVFLPKSTENSANSAKNGVNWFFHSFLNNIIYLLYLSTGYPQCYPQANSAFLV